MGLERDDLSSCLEGFSSNIATLSTSGSSPVALPIRQNAIFFPFSEEENENNLFQVGNSPLCMLQYWFVESVCIV